MLFVVIAGYSSSAMLYALASYGFTGVGIMSRTMNGPLLYLTIGLSGFVAIASDYAGRMTRYRKVRSTMLYGTALCLLAILASANLLRSQEWLVLWKRELAVLKSIPATTIERSLAEGPAPLAIIVQTANDAQGQVFAGSSDLSCAVAYYYPQFSPAIRRMDLVLLPAREEVVQTRWSGTRIEQRMNGRMIESLPAARACHLFIRESGDATLFPFAVD